MWHDLIVSECMKLRETIRQTFLGFEGYLVDMFFSDGDA
jgi:hypothetical protein